jgi:Protein of unknown function (DUF1656)
MKFVEVDLFGVYVAPISLMMVVAWVAVMVLRRTAVSVCCAMSGNPRWLRWA